MQEIGSHILNGDFIQELMMYAKHNGSKEASDVLKERIINQIQEMLVVGVHPSILHWHVVQCLVACSVSPVTDIHKIKALTEATHPDDKPLFQQTCVFIIKATNMLHQSGIMTKVMEQMPELAEAFPEWTQPES